MKYLILIIILTIPLQSNAKGGYGYKNYSFLYGVNYNPNYKFSNSFELLYDRAKNSCVGRDIRYHGLGLTANLNYSYSEYGFKGQINPTNSLIYWKIRRIAFPYVFLQGNLRRESLDDISKQTYNFRPGIGVIESRIIGNGIELRTGVQLGYTIENQKIENYSSPLTFELKLGIAYNKYRHRKS